MKKIFLLVVFLSIVILSLPAAFTTAQGNEAVRLAYVKDNLVTLADDQGQPLAFPGPELGQWQSAKLFWSPNGDSLYIATRQGLFVTGSEGGAAVRLPGEFGLTVTIARHGGVIYNLDVDSPQETLPGLLGFPLRETNVANMQGGKGRLIGTIGAFQPNTANAVLSHASAVYAKDNGLLEGGRPHIFPTYGGALFFTCCFPEAGLGLIVLGQDPVNYDPTFIVGASSTNATLSRLAAPTTEGYIRTYDLITEGRRDYTLETATGVIERTAWSLDETVLYFISREQPANPLELKLEITYPADTRSADLVLWELNLINGAQRYVTSFGDGFGVSSLAVTNSNIFAVVVESNERLINDLNQGVLLPNIAQDDPALDAYVPRTTLWRVEIATDEPYAVDEGIWGVVARPY